MMIFLSEKLASPKFRVATGFVIDKAGRGATAEPTYILVPLRYGCPEYSRYA
jgi:hypothetical protein